MSPRENCFGFSTSRARTMRPAHVPKIGLPSAWNFSSAGTNRPASMSFSSVVLSPPGTIRPSTASSSSGVRTSADSTPTRSSAFPCSAKSPWSARTPIFIVSPVIVRARALPAQSFRGGGLRKGGGGPPAELLPAPGLEQVLLGQLRRLDAGHRLSQLFGDLRQHLGILVVRRRLDDGPGPAGRIRRLENPRAHEDRLGPELHHQSGVRGGGDPAGREVRDGKPAVLCHPPHELVRRPELLGLGPPDP